jgi:hypothetical protein
VVGSTRLLKTTDSENPGGWAALAAIDAAMVPLFPETRTAPTSMSVIAHVDARTQTDPCMRELPSIRFAILVPAR